MANDILKKEFPKMEKPIEKEPAESKAASTTTAKENTVAANTQSQNTTAANTETQKTTAEIKQAKGKRRKQKRKNILFVCSGNTCRSPMAEYILKYILKKKGMLELYNVTSGGISAVEGQEMAQNARLALKGMGISTRKRKSKQLDDAMLTKADLVICMTNAQKEMFIECEKIKSIGEITGAGDVLDPYGQSIEAYKKVAAYLNYAMVEVLELAESGSILKKDSQNG